MHIVTVRLDPDAERVIVDLTHALRDIQRVPAPLAAHAAVLSGIAQRLEALLPKAFQCVVEPVEGALRVG